MTYHPAEFARRGFELLEEIKLSFHKNKDNPVKISGLIANYDRQVIELLKSRLKWTRKDYLRENINILIKGSITSLLLFVIAIILLEKIGLYSLSLVTVFKFYLLIAIGGGGIFCFLKGPRGLTAAERENKTLLSLFISARFLKERYGTLKQIYEVKKSGFKKTVAGLEKKLEHVPDKKDNRNFNKPKDKLLAARQNKANTNKKKSRSWELSENERENRRTLFSSRFLMKIAKLKGDSNKNENAKVLIIEPDLEVQQAIVMLLEDDFQLYAAAEIDEGINLALEGKPRLIICEAEFPEYEKFHLVEELKNKPEIAEIPVIVFTDDDRVENLNHAKLLSAVDYWKKNYDDEKQLMLDKQDIIDKINAVLDQRSDNRQSSLDQKMEDKENQQKESSAAQQQKEKKDLELLKEQQRNKAKIFIVSKDYMLLTSLREELPKHDLIPIVLSDFQQIFGLIAAERPQIIVVDDNMSEKNVFNICRMLNLRFSSLKIILVLTKDMEFTKNTKSADLKILKKFCRPYNQKEVIECVLENIDRDEYVEAV